MVFLLCGVAIASQLPFPIASFAIGDDPANSERPVGENRWVPSLAITAGAIFQNQNGSANSVLFEGVSTDPIPLRGSVDGDDLVIAPFVGASLEVMAPAFAIPTRPRLFVSGEILPSFGADYNLAVEGDPGCLRGPLPDAPCAKDIVEFGATSFGENSLNGRGTETTSTIDTLVYGANFGVAFPVRAWQRQLRIKPSFGWINYKVKAEGIVVDGACEPANQCTDTIIEFDPFPPFVTDGFLRETTLTASSSKTFNGIGPGLDIEMDTGRFGPLGASLFLGGRAYYILGNRKIAFGTSESFDDPVGTDVAAAKFEVEVDPWLFRAHVGIRIHWLGSQN
ncbi:MAG: hypothetical protein JRG80_19390 [Deltaproteobacteria bacterium]|nr:hypothetical protein [Deltaproteobacteria bacterium]